MAEGHLLLVLHCHLPHVRHPDHDDFLEEDWFYEAVSESYVPLLLMTERLEADGVPCAFTLALSPTLCEMLSNELLRARCTRYLDRHVELAQKEVARCAGTPFEPAARMYDAHYLAVRDTFAGRLRGGLLPAFAELWRRGLVELIGSAATHALLPLLATPESRRAQVSVGLKNFEKHFGRRPAGFWLPECAYEPGVDRLLADAGAGYFFMDTHGVLLAEPRPPLGVFAPVATPAGPLAFGRDVETSQQVWSADEGYPGDPEYREFYRDLGFDAPPDRVAACVPPDRARRYLGFKYHRVTGDVPLERKEPYRPAAAAQRAREHAAHFVRQRLDQVTRIRRATGVAPLIVAPYDGELFGHWWLEGVQFLEQVFRLLADQDAVACTTPSAWLERHAGGRAAQAAQPAPSTWGDRGYYEPWLNGSNDWIYRPLRRAEAAMAEAARSMQDASGLARRALNQCARHLMIAQGSDWPFLIYTGTARGYAERRFRDQIERFNRLMGQVRAGRVVASDVQTCEWLDDPFPEMDYRAFAPAE